MKKDYKTEKTKFKLEALYKEYATRTKEVEFHSGRYHRNVGYVQTYLTALSSLATYIYITQVDFFEKASKSEVGLHHFEIIGVLTFLTMFLFFLHATMMDTLYMLMANGNRIGVIEKKVNNTINASAMEWENKVMPFVLTDKWWVANGSLRPQPLVFLSISTLYIFAIGILCFFAWKYANSLFGYYVVPTVLFTAFFLWQWIQLSMLNGGRFLKNSIFYIFDLEKKEEWDTDLNRYLIAPLTVAFGFGVFAMLSLQTGTFLPTEEHPFGLMAIPSIFIGDLIFLPFLNRIIYDIFKVYCKTGYSFDLKFIVLTFLVTIISFSSMGFLHYTWTQDIYTGFMDIEFGILSKAGWCHFIFSSIELTFIIMTIIGGVTSFIKKNQSIYQSFHKFTFMLFLFTLISIADFIVKIFIFEQLFIEWFSFLPLILTFILWRCSKKYQTYGEKNESKNS